MSWYIRAICMRRGAILVVPAKSLPQLLALDVGRVRDRNGAALGDDLLSSVGTLDLPEAIVLYRD